MSNGTRYAATTEVSTHETRLEIEQLLTKHGATGVVSGFHGSEQAISFEIGNRRVRIIMRMPTPDDAEFARTPERGIRRSPEARKSMCDQAIRARWRALLLMIRAKLEAVELNVTTLEDAFLADMLVPTAQGVARVGDWVAPQVRRAYELGEMPSLLALPAAREEPTR